MIRVRRWLDSSKVREMCIRYNYYTSGDCRAYERMLANARDIDPDTDIEGYKQIAIDIVDHTSRLSEDCEGYTFKDCVEGIMYGLLSECTDMYVEMDGNEVGGRVL